MSTDDCVQPPDVSLHDQDPPRDRIPSLRRLIASTFASLDGFMQAPGGPEEDPTGGFSLGGWMFAAARKHVALRTLMRAGWNNSTLLQVDVIPATIALKPQPASTSR